MPYFLAALWLQDLNELNEEDLWEHYEQCLRGFDWTYHASDDADVWHIGQQQEDHLNQVRERCVTADAGRAERMFYEHSFIHNEDGSLAYPRG